MADKYEEIYWLLVGASEESLEAGMVYILSVKERDYPTLLEACKDNGYDFYTPYVQERVDQLKRFWFMEDYVNG